MRIPVSVRIAGIVFAVTLVAPAATIQASVDEALGADPTRVSPSQTEPMDLLPDVRMAPLYGMSLELRPNGHVRLHFGTIGWNVGVGPLEADGTKPANGDNYMTVRQRIYDDMGGSRTRRTPAVMIYDVGDHHDHYHLVNFMFVQLYKPSAPDDVYGLRKIGYCLLDARRMVHPPAGSPEAMVYPHEACGHADSTSVTTGLSIGWGDDYPPMWAHQWMDVTDLPLGKYRICATVDPFKFFTESNEDNNQRWTKVRIDVSTLSVTVLETTEGACGPGIP